MVAEPVARRYAARRRTIPVTGIVGLKRAGPVGDSNPCYQCAALPAHDRRCPTGSSKRKKDRTLPLEWQRDEPLAPVDVTAGQPEDLADPPFKISLQVAPWIVAA